MAIEKGIFTRNVLEGIEKRRKNARAEVEYKDERVGRSYSVQTDVVGVYAVRPAESTNDGVRTFPLGELGVVYANDELPDVRKKLFEMDLMLSDEGHLVGLNKDQFLFWYQTSDRSTTYQLVYRVDDVDPKTATVDTIRKYKPDEMLGNIDVKTGLREIKADQAVLGMDIPERIDWVATFAKYYLGQELHGEQITSQPLVALN